MSDSQSISLPELTKEDYKNMAKQREKAKRDQNAKQAKISATFGEPAMPSSVSFPAPVKVAGEDANVGRIMGVRFEDFNNIIKQCRTTDVVGVERQPATPLPGKSVDRKFFNSNTSSRKLDYQSNSSNSLRSNKSTIHNQNSVDNIRNDLKYNKQCLNSVSNDGQGKTVSNSLESKVESGNNRTTGSDRSSLLNTNSLQKPDQKTESSDSVPQSAKSNKTREPVLQTMKKELIGKKTPESSQSFASYQKSSSSKAVLENKNGRQSADARTVLKEKEENRNADVMNGAKLKNRPKLHIPENVEEMLKEFQVPQPLTGIQTPFKESQFPFSDKIHDRKDLNIVGKSSKDLMKSLSEICANSKDIGKTTVPEEIQDSSSNSSGCSSSEGENEDDVDSVPNDHNDEGFDIDGIIESGDHPATRVSPKLTVSTSHSSTEKRKALIAEKVPPLSTKTALQKTAVEIESHGMGQSCSSSESSSSGSESDSENTSDTESDKDVSDDGNHHPTPQGTPSNPDNMETSPSSGSKRWNLGAFLQQPQLMNMGSKPPSCEAPASNKSDQFEEDTEMKRGADHVSDENPPSVDHDLLSKPMSADEFSPPAPVEPKHILSPIKSPLASSIKSPLPVIISPLHYHTPKAIEKGFPPSVNVNEMSSHSKTVNVGKQKDCNTLSSKLVTDGPETKGRRSRKKKQNTLSVATIDTSESDSDIEVDVLNRSSDSALSSPQKPLPMNSQLSKKYSSLDKSLCSSNLGMVKRKETKREKLLKEKDSVKLKREIAKASGSSKDCDSKKASRVCVRSFTDSIDDMLDTFSGEKPLSPIRSVTNMHQINPTEQDLIRAGLNVSTKKQNSLSGIISCARGKPVLVKIDLNLLEKILCVDRHSPNFLKCNEHISVKHHKKLTSAKNSTSVTRSKKVHTDTLKDKFSSASNINANNIHIPDIDLSDKKYVPEKESLSNNSWTKKDIPKSHVQSFESLPVQELVKCESSSDNLYDSDSEGSVYEIEDSKNMKSEHVSLSTSNNLSFNPSPLDKKKRKLNTSRDDDTKRRKTLSKSPASTQSSDLIKESQLAEVNVLSKRERHGSASSQHSTVSNVSQRSSHSQKDSQGHHSHKRARTHEDCGQGYSGLRPSSGAINRPYDRSKSTAVVTPVVKYESLDTPSQNGFVVHNPPFYRSMLSDKEEEERLLPAEDYNRKAKKYKYQADDMDPGLTKFVLYLESVLCFIQYGYAQERDHKISEASNMYKETYRFVSHQFHQFRMYHDSETSDKAHKLTVLCLRIQSLVYLKLYMLKKNETVKLKRILEDHNNKNVKSSSQPKAPSAPSPHQPSWNRSTGTPSPMSPTPSPANSVCSVGSVGSDVTPSKISNGSSGQSQIAPPGSVIVPQRIHSITQKYFSNTCYLIQAHELWDQATSNITSENRDFFAQLDLDCGPLTLHSSLLHLVRYVKQAISLLNL